MIDAPGAAQRKTPLEGLKDYNGDQIRIEQAFSPANEAERRAPVLPATLSRRISFVAHNAPLGLQWMLPAFCGLRSIGGILSKMSGGDA